MAVRECAEQGCKARATDRCFECGKWLCERHLTRISVPTYEDPFQQRVCGSCLEGHLTQTDPYGRATIVKAVKAR